MSSYRIGVALLLFVFANSIASAQDTKGPGTSVRILSWNVSGDAFAKYPNDFRSVLARADADIILLDEVVPSTDLDQLHDVLAEANAWQIDFGISGGRQRGVIASRLPMESIVEFSSVLEYDKADQQQIDRGMSARDRNNRAHSMENGIPINGAIVTIDGRRLLVVVVDLQCCGNDPASWQETRRRIESADIQDRVLQVLDRVAVDGIVLAGDFNLVATQTPLHTLAGPYPSPHLELSPVDLTHLGHPVAWTWDGRNTPFPSGVLDFQLYSPRSLAVGERFILDTEDLSDSELEQFDLEFESSNHLSRHRPLLVEYSWR
jgi:hypothetical protein